ncbi:hypothetical protein [Flavobacteriaceae bacterium 14752]|uniref:hypothetical protein n=1 Tax=Mesohalobacter salilacus TaxID=2491711 RepID=UPI000F632E20|nr:hypothetical protein EIG84_02830 [Flavobacteriaceae bacterium 14752]
MKDLRKDFDYSPKSFKMSKGHDKKFKHRLVEAFGKKPKQDFSMIYKMAAVAIIAMLSTIFVLNQTRVESDDSTKQVSQTQKIGLGDISPELNNIENYYLTSIKFELATLETSTEFDAVINSYLEELQHINKAYDDLENELNSVGISEEIINAMIDNLQLRLKLLQDLKQKLNHLKQKQNENKSAYQI